MKVMLSVAYDGTNYFGWQKQKDKTTISGEIENALEKIYGEKITVFGASRTDSGVHSLDQKCIFIVHKSSIPITKLKLVLNHYLPNDIVVTNSKEVLEDFDLLGTVKNKTYSYSIDTGEFENPINSRYAYYCTYDLDIKKMEEACLYFIGTYDFIGFSSTGSVRQNTIRTINDCHIERDKDLVKIVINGNGFLYNMVRIISGTLIDVGIGKVEPTDIMDIIESKDRKRAGKTAIAKGLILEKIFLE